MSYIDQETLQKIDYLIKGVADGKFDEITKKIEFVKKLSGDHETPFYLQDVLLDLEEVQRNVQGLESRYQEILQKHQTLEQTYQADITNVAKALRYLFNPDPLKSTWDLQSIETFISCNAK